MVVSVREIVTYTLILISCIFLYQNLFSRDIPDSVVKTTDQGLVELSKSSHCFRYERCCCGSSIFCNEYCIITLGKPNGGYCAPGKGLYDGE
ncbi:transmembrane protein, putative [Medicago truncatula]|uniref:Transmembrane protein, putative n=1 Tax=Medicago truncatula TaxID=3880 RepID=A0A072V7R8_MEDTR|nr:transmembrane protein, putative [Medicago truncatula]